MGGLPGSHRNWRWGWHAASVRCIAGGSEVCFLPEWYHVLKLTANASESDIAIGNGILLTKH